ncbi:MAG: TIGR03936 family radical SAM-associated protein [Chloroflexota bacterium]
MQRFRITYNKGASLQYIGNLDLHKVWERYLRRARIPLAYTQGFHPQPHIQQAAPLPLGFLSENDLLDVWVQSENWPPADFLTRLQVTHQPGIEIVSIADIPLNSPSLPTLIISSLYRVILLDPYDADDLKDRLENLQKQSTILRTRRNKTYDLRPLIEQIDLFLNPLNQCAEFRMQLAAREGATGRPDEVIGELGFDPYAARYIRTGFIMKE